MVVCQPIGTVFASFSYPAIIPPNNFKHSVQALSATEDIDMPDAYDSKVPGNWEDVYDGPLYHMLPPGKEGSLHSYAGMEAILNMVTNGMRPDCGNSRLHSKRLTSAYDAYLEIMRKVDTQVAEALGRDKDWEKMNVCPLCLYVLDGEPKLQYSFFASVNRNNSLKLVDSSFRAGNPCFNACVLTSWQWLTAAQVDVFKNEVKNSQARSSKTKEDTGATSVDLPPSVDQESLPTENLPTATDFPDEDVAWLNINKLNKTDVHELKQSISVCMEC
ncbi:unnamed protein product [Mycena citricolor]|uniref:Uncharacterized protein n=1 Tax=Mycena citricolor TaxID=2018698 RepID=A0AAD2Q2Q8_9AGAR|nr:unnamed protein product [Mycena citricolor]